MPVAYRIDKSQHLQTVVWDGRITAGEWRDHLNETFADPDWPAVTRSLTDLRSADISEITRADRTEMIAMYGPHLDTIRGTKSAAIAGDNFDASREFEAESSPTGLRLIIFNDLLNACTWLGIDKAAAQATVNDLRRSLRDGEAPSAP